ncbi:MAG: helix-turn-helix transcriptional regulator [Bacteroidales bacterium]|nr:helix-turn-helix transcriptional regulator [Bacteroidales bacterium]
MEINGIADYVKSMRKKYRLTQVDLAWRSGVGLRFVRELEQGKATVRLDTVNKVLRLFGSQVGVVPAPRPTFDDNEPSENEL